MLPFLLAVAVCAALYGLSRGSRRITPAVRDVAVNAEGSFTPDGQYPGEPFADAVKVRAWGSWSGSDDNEGTLALGPFSAPRIVRFGVGGYPNHAGNELFVERVDTAERLSVPATDAGERWRVVDFELPAAWKDQPIRLVAIDHAAGIAGWLAITEPIRGGRSDGNNALLESLAAWAITGTLLGLIYVGAARVLSRRSAINPDLQNRGDPLLPPQWIPLGAGAVVALCGYVAFWAYFANPLLGKIVSGALIAAGAFFALRGRSSELSAEVATTTKLLVAIGGFYLALLHLFPTSHDFYTLAANRYREGLPADSVLPHAIAERLFLGRPAKEPLGEWRSSERPPLQSGWQLLTWPAARALSADRATMSGTAAVWFQLLWVLAAHGLLRSVGINRTRTAAWIAACALSGFFVQNTVFTWPKLSAGAFACGAFGVILLSRRPTEAASHLVAGGVFAALAWLSHGGAAFSLLALAPWVLWRMVRGAWRPWLAAAAVFLLLALPWRAYQQFYDPPGDRLLKFHLTNQQTRDDTRGLWETLRESYRARPWLESWAVKAGNVREQLAGNFTGLLDLLPDRSSGRREDEFFHTVRGLTWWPVLALIALVATRRRLFAFDRGELATLAGWIALTMGIWCLLMFHSRQAVIHQGSYALMIGAFVVCSVVLERAGRGWLGVIACLQAITLATTWAVANPTIHGPTSGLAFAIVMAAVVGWFVIAAFTENMRSSIMLQGGAGSPSPPEFQQSQPETQAGSESRLHRFSATRTQERIAAWWQNPQLNAWVLLALAVLLFLRKPHALHTPQLWAEDGSIFLMQNDAHGIGAWFIPYMGYLHLLPRLIAFAASHLLDPAWWPGFYNGVSFVIWIGVLARLFSPRLDLPGKPWLALAFFLGPNTGEVLFNITNLQWLTAFVLVQQVLIARPTTRAQRIGDWVCVALAALTGPFVIVFAPLFAWRWWRDRHRDNLVLLLVVGVCAAAQAWFVVRTGPKFDYQSAPFHWLACIDVMARRLLVWPVAGDTLARELPPHVIGAVGGLFIVALLIWALRPHPRRQVRATIVAAFTFILLAGAYRTRPDTWAGDNLVYADRYFYIPRVLLAWILILEFDAIPRGVATVARLTCALAVCVHLRDYQVHAPPDYHWAQHIEPIRRGVPGEIPTLPEGWTLEYRGRPQGGK